MVVEFMGLPGVGKSYLGKQIEKELSVRGLKCISVVERSRSSFPWKVLAKIVHIAVPYIPCYRQRKQKMICIAEKYAGLSPAYNDGTVKISDYIGKVVFLEYLYSKLKTKKTVFIFDEGIAQQFANMIVNFGVTDETIQDMADSLNSAQKTVYITYPVSKIKESIILRNRHVCFIDELRGAELDGFLTSYQNACDSIAQRFRPIRIERESTGQANMDEVIRRTIG